MNIGPVNIRISDRAKNLVRIDGFEVLQNKITFLFGESGIGKTLISKAIYGLLNPSRFDISLNDADYRNYLKQGILRNLQENSFFVFQEPSSHLNPTMTLREQLREGTLRQNNNEEAILRQLWQEVQPAEIETILNTFPKPYRPSGGEKQRILLAMAFKKIELIQVNQPTFFVFDEPTGNLDNRYRNLVLERIYHYFKHKPFTLLFITHDYTIIHELYANYRAFLSFTEFKELYRPEDGQSALRSFSAEDYLRWEKRIISSPATRTKLEPILTLKNSFSVFGRNLKIYGDAEHQQPRDLHVYPGSLIYLKAPSGVGKTTLAKILLGLIKPQTFSASIAGLKIDARTPEHFWRKHIWGKQAGMVFQHADEGLNLKANIYQTFSALPLKKKLTSVELIAMLDPVFSEKVDTAFLHKKIGQLSGGQKQRVNIMRTLALNTKLIILDEPLNGLDFHSIQKILELIEAQRRNGAAFLIISHNEDIFDKLTRAEDIFYLG